VEINYNVAQGHSGKDGKSYWKQLGIGRKHENGFWIKLDALPLPNKDGEVWLQLYEKVDEHELQKKSFTR
jgi:hypothetical protein